MGRPWRGPGHISGHRRDRVAEHRLALSRDSPGHSGRGARSVADHAADATYGRAVDATRCRIRARSRRRGAATRERDRTPQLRRGRAPPDAPRAGEGPSSNSGSGSPRRSCSPPSGQAPPFAATSAPSVTSAAVAVRSRGPRRPVKPHHQTNRSRRGSLPQRRRGRTEHPRRRRQPIAARSKKLIVRSGRRSDRSALRAPLQILRTAAPHDPVSRLPEQGSLRLPEAFAGAAPT